MADIARRFPENPILRPADICPSVPGMKIECLLNPGVFRFQGKTWLLLRVAERPSRNRARRRCPCWIAWEISKSLSSTIPIPNWTSPTRA